MSGANRLLRISRALQSDHQPPSSSSSSSSSNSCRLPRPRFLTIGGEKSIPPGCPRKRVAAVSPDTAVISPEKKHEPSLFERGMEIVDLSSSRINEVARLALTLLGPPPQEATKGYCTAHSEMLVERGIAGCQSFTLIAVAGSLIGSVLCFVEGCFHVLEAFFEYFHVISQGLDQGGIIQLLIEAIVMFLVGTALLTFGIGLYVMFSGLADAKHGKSPNPALAHLTSRSSQRQWRCRPYQRQNQ